LGGSGRRDIFRAPDLGAELLVLSLSHLMSRLLLLTNCKLCLSPRSVPTLAPRCWGGSGALLPTGSGFLPGGGAGSARGAGVVFHVLLTDKHLTNDHQIHMPNTTRSPFGNCFGCVLASGNIRISSAEGEVRMIA